MSKAMASFKASEEVLLLLEDAKQKLDQSIDRLPGIYFIIDETGRVYRNNYELRSFLKIDNALLQEIQFFDYLSKEDLNLLRNSLAQAVAQPGDVFHQEVVLCGASGALCHYSLSLYAWVTGIKGSRIFFTVHGKDVSILKKVSQQKELLLREVKGAEQIQQLMLPERQLEFDRAKISCFYRSASECGGDFLYYEKQDDVLKIWTGDVTGHGVGPAMISGAMRAAVAVMESGKEEISPEEGMQRLNDCLFSVAHGEYWMTFQIVQFDLKNNLMKLCQAGHTEVYRLDKNNLDTMTWKDFDVIDLGKSHPLGMTQSPQFKYIEQELHKDSVYFSFSDGLDETYDQEKRAFGKRRILKKFLESYGTNQDLQQTQEYLLKCLAEFRNHGPLEDDLSYWSFSVD